jgi:hypothetical protein
MISLGADELRGSVKYKRISVEQQCFNVKFRLLGTVQIVK